MPDAFNNVYIRSPTLRFTPLRVAGNQENANIPRPLRGTGLQVVSLPAYAVDKASVKRSRRPWGHDPAPRPNPRRSPAVPEAEIPFERELNDMIGAADESRDAIVQTAAAPHDAVVAALPSPLALKRLFAALQIRPGAGGGNVIEAPPDVAAGLAALFEGMAQMLRTPAA